MNAGGAILVVDDEELIRKLVSFGLSESRRELLVAADGLEALKALRSKKVALVVMDIEMPGLNGIDLLRIIRTDNALRDVRVLILSAYAVEKYRRIAESLGANRYMTKPYRQEELETAVGSLLSAGGGGETK